MGRNFLESGIDSRRSRTPDSRCHQEGNPVTGGSGGDNRGPEAPGVRGTAGELQLRHKGRGRAEAKGLWEGGSDWLCLVLSSILHSWVRPLGSPQEIGLQHSREPAASTVLTPTPSMLLPGHRLIGFDSSSLWQLSGVTAN